MTKMTKSLENTLPLDDILSVATTTALLSFLVVGSIPLFLKNGFPTIRHGYYHLMGINHKKVCYGDGERRTIDYTRA